MTTIPLNADEQALIEDIDRVIAESQGRIIEAQNQRAGALNMILRGKRFAMGTGTTVGAPWCART